jgi:hypothetical protein
LMFNAKFSLYTAICFLMHFRKRVVFCQTLNKDGNFMLNYQWIPDLLSIFIYDRP